MSSARTCLILGASTLALAVVMNGCWVDSSVGTPPAGTPLGGSSPGAGGSSAGASPAGGSAPTAGSEPMAGAPAAGAPAGGAPAGGSGGAPAGGAPAGGAPAGGSGGAGACPAPTGTHQTTALDRSCWVATASDCSTGAANPDTPNKALDASQTTRFSTGALQAGMAYTYQLDMGSAVMIAGVKVFTNSATDYAAELKIEVSTNGTTWTPVACGAGMGTTDFSFAAVSARHVRLTQGGDNTGWWAIHDLNVYGATAADTACPTPGQGATSTACTTNHN